MKEADKFVIVKIEEGNNIFYKAILGWYGGYLGSDSYKVNSGISKLEEIDDYYLIHGYSGSMYKVYKKSMGFTSLTSQIYDSLKEVAEINNFKIELVENIQDLIIS
jgi:hypothetical protein